MKKQPLIETHNFLNSSIFQLKMTLLIVSRFFKNFYSPARLFKDEGKLIDQPVVAASESELWNPFDNKQNWILTAGKIENLRVATQKINGLEVKANQVFSFWKHIGRPVASKGYVIGREIREGCIVPTIAGGLCQLSNALYDAALKANFEIIERHKHTKVIKGSLAEQDRDATVKWNYIDLRFKSSADLRIEIELTSDKLLVAFRSPRKDSKLKENHSSLKPSSKLNDCYSCGNLACSKHSGKIPVEPASELTTFILDEKWPEYDEYVQKNSTQSDTFIFPLKGTRFLKTDRYAWTVKNPDRVRATTKEGIYRALKLRFFLKRGSNVFKEVLELDKKVAKHASRLIPLESTHVVISQNLLPFVFETGALGGRTFDVLMTRLPMEKLHQRLDVAHSLNRESATLNDFRAPRELIDLENKALTKARKVITPHSEIAEMFHYKVERLQWKMAPTTTALVKGEKVLFPASAVGRKGAFEIRRLAKELDLKLVVLGNTLEKEGFWEGMKIEKFQGDFDQIAVVVFPAYVEHQPRLILKAIPRGIPVITTTATGLKNSEKVRVIEIGNYQELKFQTEIAMGMHLVVAENGS